MVELLIVSLLVLLFLIAAVSVAYAIVYVVAALMLSRERARREEPRREETTEAGAQVDRQERRPLSRRKAMFDGLRRASGIDLVTAGALGLALVAAVGMSSVLWRVSEREIATAEAANQVLSGDAREAATKLSGISALLLESYMRPSRRFIEFGGATFVWLEDGLAEYFDFAETGALVVGVDRLSPADQLGIAPGDVLVALGEVALKEPQDLGRMQLLYRGLENPFLSESLDTIAASRRTDDVLLSGWPRFEEEGALPIVWYRQGKRMSGYFRPSG